MQGDLYKIKKKYGEEMAHLCRKLFPTLLEQDGVLYNMLENEFPYSKLLYEDIVLNELELEFQNHLLKQYDAPSSLKNSNLTPFELMSEANYDLYECKSEEDIQAFKKYYANGEELCTFNGNRLDTCDVFFAVKKNIDDIKRSDRPIRQDEYGTSVISIQFSKDNHVLSIKNRYNHKVVNPDATFSNNLENIIPGLTSSFQKYLNYEIDFNESGFDIPYYIYVDGKYYRYNQERHNIYYCPNNTIIDNGKVKYYDPSRYLLINNFIIDLKNKTIKQYKPMIDFGNGKEIVDSFPLTIGKINSIEVIKKDINKIIKINDHILIEVDRFNRIVGYVNDYIEDIPDYFIYFFSELKYLSLERARNIGNYFLYYTDLDYLKLDNVKFIGDNFMSYNKKMKYISLPNVKTIGNRFMNYISSLKAIKMDNIISIGDDFLWRNMTLKFLYAPKLKFVGGSFLARNLYLKELSLPSLEKAGEVFLYRNKKLSSIKADSLEIVGNGFLSNNLLLDKLSLPKVKTIGRDFMTFNRDLKELYLPCVEKIGENFLDDNEFLEVLYMPKLKEIGTDYLLNNYIIDRDYIYDTIELNKNKKKRKTLHK